MLSTEKPLLVLLSLATFLATIGAAFRSGLSYPVELVIVALLGVVLVASLALDSDDGISSFLSVLFFLAAVANALYLHTVVGYFSPARLIVLLLSVTGILLSGLQLLAQPIPAALSAEARSLLAAEQKLAKARETLETVNFGKTAPASRKDGKGKGRRRK